MRFDLVNLGDHVQIQNAQGERVMFELNSYRTARIETAGDLFRPINDFLSRLPAVKAAALFGLYSEAKDIFMVSRHEEVLDKNLKDIFRRIFNTIDLQYLRNYVEINSDISIPHDIKSSYEDVEVGFLRDKTYIREEYIELLTYTVAVRFCFPIWGEYMSLVDSYATADGKEYHAYSLLQESILPRQPAYDRLIRYVTASTTTAVETSAATLKGVGRDSIPEWLTSMVIVRKLPLIDLFNASKGNIINAVYSYVDNHLKRIAKKFMEDARERKNESGSSDGEKDQSYVETYRAKQDITYGQLETNIVYLEGDLVRCCQDIDPTCDPAIVEAVQAVMPGIEQEILYSHNHILTKWVIDKAISTLQLDIIERRIAVRSMIIAQSLMHHWGLHHLALLVTGIRVPTATAHSLGERQSKLTAEHLAILDEIYPYTIPTNVKSQSRNKNQNYGYISVIDMGNVLTRHTYAVRTPAFITKKEIAPGTIDRYGHMQTPPSITHELVGLIVKLNELN